MKTSINKHSYIIIVLFFLLSTSVHAQIKGMYVNDFKFIVGDIAKEDELLQYALDSGFTYLIFYNLYHIHNNIFDITDPVSAEPLADFLTKAKDLYGITKTAAVGETFNSFNTIHNYNLDHLATPSAQFDIYNLEFEFWNLGSTGPGGYYCTTYLEPGTCDTVAAFDFSLNEMCRIDSLTGEYAWLSSEVYIGNPSVLQCSKLAKCADRVLAHYYRSSDVYMGGNSIYNYKKYRMEPLVDSVPSLNIMPIFNSKSSFMGPWLETHPLDQAFDTWMDGVNAYNDEMGAWTSKVTIDGAIWYRWTDLKPDVPLPLDLVEFKAKQIERDVFLEWKYLDNNIKNVSIFRQSNKTHWAEIGSSECEENILCHFTDKTASPGFNKYKLQFKYQDGSSDYSKIISVNLDDQKDLKIYPQPASSSLYISWDKQIKQYDIRVFNQLGQLVLNQNNVSKVLDVSDLENGIYFLEIMVDNHTYFKRCMIKK